MDILIITFFIITIILLLFIMYLLNKSLKRSNTGAIRDKIESGNQTIRELIIHQQKVQNSSILDLSSTLKDSFYNMEVELLKNSSEGQIRTQEMIARSLKDIQDANNRRLQDIQNNVNEKLDKSLNERLDSSFKQIGDQLSTLYKSLGELQSLSSGVSDLQKTLSNVKTRGIFGEVQLKNEMIQKKLSKVEIMDESDASRILGISGYEDGSD